MDLDTSLISYAESNGIIKLLGVIDRTEILLNGSLPIVKQFMSQNSLSGTVLSIDGDRSFIMLLNVISATIRNS
ncbi:MAG: hypothetical protein WBX01_08150 [Nitrososphaeraceae archaeon]